MSHACKQSHPHFQRSVRLLLVSCGFQRALRSSRRITCACVCISSCITLLEDPAWETELCSHFRGYEGTGQIAAVLMAHESMSSGVCIGTLYLRVASPRSQVPSQLGEPTGATDFMAGVGRERRKPAHHAPAIAAHPDPVDTMLFQGLLLSIFGRNKCMDHTTTWSCAGSCKLAVYRCFVVTFRIRVGCVVLCSSDVLKGLCGGNR